MEDRKGNRAVKMRWVRRYTICFCILAAAIFSVFIQNKKSFIWQPDGIQQHFNALLYYRTWLREILHNVFIEHNFEIPLWDMNIGLGSDVITTLHYYVVGDPLNLLSILVPEKEYMEYFFEGLILLRIYLAGLAFLAYCFYHEKEEYPVLLGSLLYAFCFWSIVSIRHPYFLNPMIYLPLVLMGVDKILKKEKATLYMVMLALATISSFYFSYMICIFVVIYTVIRYLMLFKRIRIKELAVWVGRFLLYSIIALAMSAVILIPVVMVTLSTGRAQAQNYLPALYPITYYFKLFSSFLIGGAGYWSFLGYTAFGVMAVFLLFLNRHHRGIKLGFLVLTIFLLLPFAGHMMNGGSYVINRYMWAYSMLISYILVKVYPAMMELGKQKKLKLAGISFLYIGICFCVWWVEHKAALLLSVGIYLVLLFLVVNVGRREKQSRMGKGVLLLLLMGSLFYQAWDKYAPEGENYVAEFVDSGTALAVLTKDAPSSQLTESAQKDEENGQIWRYEESQTGEWKNTAMQQELNGTSYYFSLANPYINEFQRQMDINQTRDFCYSGLDGRGLLTSLFSVKYFLVPEERMDLLPSHYSEKLGKNAYASDCIVPFGFTSSYYINSDVYEELTVTQKQQALLQGIVLAGNSQSKQIQQADLNFTDQDVPYTVEQTDGVSFQDGQIEVTKEKAKVTLRYTGLKDSETYFIIEGLDYEDTSPLADVQRGESRVHISVKCEDITKKITYLSSEDNFYSDIHDYLINTGYHKDATDTITLKFQECGIYRYDTIKVVCQPMSQLQQQVDALSQESLQNVKVSDNQITGDIEVAKEKLLCLSIPYSKGWTAYVDGEETELLQADTMFMALKLQAGSHQVRLVYETPYIRISVALSMAGLLAFVAVVIWQRKSGKKRTEVDG